MQRFVIVVDTQRDFMATDGALSVPGAAALIAPMHDWLAALDPAEIAGVLFTFDTHEAEVYAASREALEFPVHCLRGSKGWGNALDAIAIDPGVPVYRLEKGVFDMWAEPGLAIEPMAGGIAVLRDAFFGALKADGIRDVSVIGVAADYCVRWAIDGLIARGFAVTVVAALTCGIERPIEQVVAEDFTGDRVVIV